YQEVYSKVLMFWDDEKECGVYKVFPAPGTGIEPTDPKGKHESPPHGSYLFLYSDPQCAVVEYKSFAFNSAGTAERADSTSAHAAKPFCTLWVRHSTITQSHTCCERFFNTTCDTSNLQVMYEAATCASSAN
ncbi:hypothetical protein MTO96_041788, partial [Rhipicephalus appendiculatus]